MPQKNSCRALLDLIFQKPLTISFLIFFSIKQKERMEKFKIADLYFVEQNDKEYVA